MNFASDSHPVFTPAEMKKICEDLRGLTRSEAIEYGRKRGIIRVYVLTLRTLLGISPARGKRITAEGVEAIKADAAAGLTIAEIAKKYNRSYFTTFAYMKRHGIEAANTGRFEWTEMKNRALVAYKMKGWTNAQIAAKVGASPVQVSSHLRALKNHRPKCFEKIAAKMGYYDYLEKQKERKKNG